MIIREEMRWQGKRGLVGMIWYAYAGYERAREVWDGRAWRGVVVHCKSLCIYKHGDGCTPNKMHLKQSPIFHGHCLIILSHCLDIP